MAISAPISATAETPILVPGHTETHISMAALPILAPRPPGCRALNDEKAYPKEHSEDEWEAMRNIIKRLYIYDNRKLVETMGILLARHGFAAT